MSALEEVAKLKAQRREELAAEQVLARQAAEAAERLEQEELLRAVRTALNGEHAGWLMEFLNAHIPGRDLHVREVRFEVPGHRPIYLRMVRVQSHVWRPADDRNDEEPFRWAGTTDRSPLSPLAPEGATNLADALILAEIEGWTPPAVSPKWPPAPEVEHAARQAWTAMLQDVKPLPPLQAIGMVEDVTGDVPAAVSAIHYVAGLWLDEQRPEQPATPPDFNSASFMAAVACRAHLLGSHYGLADDSRKQIEESSLCVMQEYDAYDPEGNDNLYDIDDYQVAINWDHWARCAARAIDLCRAVSAAASPEVQHS